MTNEMLFGVNLSSCLMMNVELKSLL